MQPNQIQVSFPVKRSSDSSLQVHVYLTLEPGFICYINHVECAVSAPSIRCHECQFAEGVPSGSMSFFTTIPPLIKVDSPPPDASNDLAQGVAYFHCSTPRCYNIWGVAWGRNVRPRIWSRLSDYLQQSHSSLCEECRPIQQSDAGSGCQRSKAVSAEIQNPRHKQIPHSDPPFDPTSKTQNKSMSVRVAKQRSAEDLDYDKIMEMDHSHNLATTSQNFRDFEIWGHRSFEITADSESEWVVVDSLQRGL